MTEQGLGQQDVLSQPETIRIAAATTITIPSTGPLRSTFARVR